MGKSTLTPSSIVVAADNGNAVQKIIVDRLDGMPPKKIRMGSLITPIEASNQARTAFQMIKGNTNWSGKGWLMGGATMIRDSDIGKIQYGLPLLIGAIWDSIVDGDVVNLLVSIHNPAAFKDDLINAYQGVHVVEHGGDRKAITIKPLGVAQEGLGAILVAKAQSPSTMLLDLGAGTGIVTLFAGVGCHPGTAAYPIDGFGSIYLERKLKTHPTVSKEVGRVLTDEEARLIVADSKHVLRVKPAQCPCSDCDPIDVDLSGAIEEIAKAWIAELCRRARQQFSTEILSTTKWVACGGSCQIPAVARALQASGITVIPSPQMANVEGLVAIARKKV